MNFNDAFSKATASLPAYEELGRRRVFQIHPNQDHFDVFLNKNVMPDLSAGTQEFLQRVTKATNNLEKLEVALISAIFRDGPKVFSLSKLPNVLFVDYLQPFETMVIETDSLVILHAQPKPVMLIASIINKDGTSLKTWWYEGRGPLVDWCNQSELLYDCVNFAQHAARRGVEPQPSARLDKLKKLAAKNNKHTWANRVRLRTCPVYYALRD